MQKLIMEYRHKTLKNGLRVYLIPDSRCLCSNATIFNTGAKDEQANEWGCAHLCEHLFFTGTRRAPESDRALSEAGGSSNAWTEHDGTVFITKGPQNLLERIIWLEQDRFHNIARELQDRSWTSEKNVVINELLETVEDVPFGGLLSSSWEALYGPITLMAIPLSAL